MKSHSLVEILVPKCIGFKSQGSLSLQFGPTPSPFFLVGCQDRGMSGRAEMEEKKEEKTRPNSKFSTLSNPKAEGVLCKATAHQKGLREFLGEVQKSHISFEQWIFMIRKEDFPDAGTKSKAWIVGQSQLFDVVCNSLKQLQTIWHHMTVRYPRTLDHRTTRYYTHLQTIMSCSAECFMFLRNTWKMAIDLLLVCFVQLKTAGTGVVTCRNQLLACPLRLHLKQTKRQPFEADEKATLHATHGPGWDIELSDAFLPLNEIRPARACATLMKPQVCNSQQCHRHFLHL